jgi:uncharacterized SAM-binding protein YcdF (DUF218 family)
MSRIWKWLRRATLWVGCWWLLVTFTPLVRWWAQALASPWQSGRGDVLVVLAGDSLDDAVLGMSSYWRAVYAVRLIRTHPFRKVILSGGGSTKPAPAELMRDFLAAHGIEISNVIVETDSTSTEENALRVAPLIRGDGKIVLLTSDYHIWRAQRVFQKLRIESETSPVPDVLKRYGSWHARAGLFVELCRETAKIGWYRWKKWI